MFKKLILALVLASFAAGAGAQGGSESGAAPFSTKSGAVLGTVSAVDAAGGEIMVGGRVIKVDEVDAARLKAGDEVTVTFSGGKALVRKAGEKARPRLFSGRVGVVMGPVASVDDKRSEVTIGDTILKISPADIARLKAGDVVTVSVAGGRASVRKAGEKDQPKPFKAKNGVVMGRVAAVDAAKNEITVGGSIIVLPAADIAGLKAGDEVTVRVEGGKAAVEKAPASGL